MQKNNKLNHMKHHFTQTIYEHHSDIKKINELKELTVSIKLKAKEISSNFISTEIENLESKIEDYFEKLDGVLWHYFELYKDLATDDQFNEDKANKALNKEAA